MKRTLLPLALLAFSGFALTGTVSLGGLLTSGNTDVRQLDSGLGITGNPSSRLETGLNLSASYGSQEEETYLEKYLAEGTLKYAFTDSDYAASRAYWTRDLFSGISHEYGATAGYGRVLVSGEAFSASLEAGGGYYSRENTLEESLEAAAWYGGTLLEWQIADSWKLTENARFSGDVQDSENYGIESVFEASSDITGNLSLVMGYDITYHNLPPVEGSEKTDTAVRVQLRIAI